MLQASIRVSSIFLDICCKCVYLDVAYVSTHMLQVFYLDVAYVCNVFQVFLGVSDACFKCFICLFCMFQVLLLDISKGECFVCLFCIFQVLLLDVSKVDWVLHMRCAWEAAGAREGPAWTRVMQA